MDRLAHVLIGALILGAFFIMSVSAYYLLKNRHTEFARKSFVPALVIGAIASLVIVYSGDRQGKIVGEYQPAKLAAMEGIYKTADEGTPMVLFGIPDSETKTMQYAVEVPGLLSLLVHGDSSKPVAGLDQFEPDVPPVAIPFFTFHIMVGMGLYFIVLTLYGLWCYKKGSLFQKRWLLWVFVFSVIGPFIANQFGWIAAEVGRQPWIVYNLLKTSDAVSKGLPASNVLGSIIMFGVIYALLFAVWIYLLNEKIKKGPESVSVSK